MGLLYWLHLFGSVLLIGLTGLFVRTHLERRSLHIDASVCDSDDERYAYLCGKKAYIATAKVASLARVPGVSQDMARVIRARTRGSPQVNIDELIAIPGLGPKTVERLKEYFY